MISNLFLIVGIVLWGYVLTSILKIKEGFGPVLGVAVSMAILEIGGAFGILWMAAKIYCIAVCIFSVIYIAGTRNKADMKTYFLNPSVIGFLFAVLFYIILSLGKTLFYTGWDTFMHWGMFSKSVFYNHNLDVWNNDLCINHRVYPHGMASWYSLFALGKRNYSERDVMLSINVLLFAASCPIVDIAVGRIRKLLPGKKINSVFVYFISGMSVASFLWIWRFSEGVWSYISGYMDIPLGVAFMAALCLAVTDSLNCYGKAFGVSLLSAMLVMIKPTGIIFVCAVWLVYLVNVYTGKEFHMMSNPVGKLFLAGISLSIPLLELGIWNVMMKYLGITGGDQFRLKSFLPGDVIMKYQSDPAYAEFFRAVIRNFFAAFIRREAALHISAFGWMILCIAIAVFTIIFQKDHREKKKVLRVNICMLFLFCLYNLFLLWTYLTTMSEGEAIGIKCYDRYIGAFIIGWFVLCIYLLFFYSIGNLKVQYIYFGVFFLCNILGFVNKNTYLKEITPEIEEVYELSENIKKFIPDITYNDSEGMPDLWISYADKEEAFDDRKMYQLKYNLFPNFDFIDIYGVQENYNREMKDIIAEFSFDYLILYGVNEDFYNSYYWFFTDDLSNAVEQYKNGHYQVYKIIRDEITNEFCWFEPIL